MSYEIDLRLGAEPDDLTAAADRYSRKCARRRREARRNRARKVQTLLTLLLGASTALFFWQALALRGVM